MADRKGHIFGSYRLIRLLGEGAFSEVYLGKNIHIGTLSAIKILKTQLAHEGSLLFRKEAQIITSLKHKNIVEVHYFGVENRTPFFVMEYAPNGCLSKRHPLGTRVPLETIVSYVKQVADALQYIHDRQLVHRDIKPHNLLLGSNEEVLVSDFGIAVITHRTSEEETSKYKGTSLYAAPEQFEGKPRPASDQYSLAIVVYEWLCGELPFQGTLEEVYYKQFTMPPPPLHEKVPDIAPAVEQVILKALSKDRHERFASIQDFAQALEEASWHRRSAIVEISSSPQPAQSKIAHPEENASHIPEQKNISSVPGTTYISYTGHNGSVRTLAWSPNGRYIASGGDDETIQVWEAASGQLVSTYHHHSHWIHAVSWSPDGRHIASVSGDKEIHVWDAATGHRHFMCHSSSSLMLAGAWSPQGRRIATGTNDGFVHIWDANNGAEIFTYRGHAGRVEAVVWSPDAIRIASASSDSNHTIQVWDASTGQHAFTYQQHSAKIYALAWSPGGKRIASGDMEGVVRLWNAATGQDLLVYGEHTDIVNGLSWSPNSKRIASASNDSTVQVWDPAKGDNLLTYPDHYEAVLDVAWSPQGELIASAGIDGSVRVWQAP